MTYDLLTPQFKSQSCECCYSAKPFVELTRHIYGKVHIKQPYLVCEGCIDDVIFYRCHCRNVSDMTGELLESAGINKYLNKAI